LAKFKFWMLLLGIMLVTVGVHAQPELMPTPAGVEIDTPDPVVSKNVLKLGMDDRISIEFRSADAGDVLRYLAHKAGLNFLMSPKVSGRVSMVVEDVPIQDIFDVVLRSNALAYDKQGEVFYIMSESEYSDFYGEKFSDVRAVEVFRLEYALPEQAFNLLDTMKSSIGRLLIDENSGTVLVMDTPKKLKKMRKMLNVMEQEVVVEIFDLQYAKALDVEEKFKTEYDVNRLGTVKADERTNQVVIQTFPSRMKEVRKIIKALDRKTREVLIDARIVKVTLDDNVDTGINWNGIFTNIDFHGVDKVGDFRATTDSTTPGSEIPNVTPIQIGPKFGLKGDGPLGTENFGNLIFTTINRTGYELFRYLNTIGETRTISKPRLLVVENEKASIHVGTKEAYVTTTTTSGTSTSTTAEEIKFIDVGIKFTVTPRITKTGYIEMTIEPEVSSVVRTLTTNSGNQIPIVDTSTAKTKVLVKDGTTVIIAGLRKHEKKYERDDVPWLSRIPLLGTFDNMIKMMNCQNLSYLSRPTLCMAIDL